MTEKKQQLASKVGHRFKKGESGNKAGRKAGVPNKLTTDVKTMILAALDKAGGPKYLAEQAEKNPSAFMTLVGKVLPLQVNANHEGKLSVTIVTGVPTSPDEPE